MGTPPDPVHLLNGQFLATALLAPLFPDCGTDPEGDADGVTFLESQPGCA